VSAPIITFLSDYGYDDAFVGVCHGVIARLCAEARVIDITHGIARHDVRAGALALRDSLAFMPTGVHLAVIDPEVGAERRAVALRVGHERVLVGPDNGLLSLAAERLGGVEEAIDIGRSPHRLEPVSATFHGRDIFAPVAARLAAGDPLADAGEPMDVAELVVLELPQPRVDAEVLVAHALTSDRFGNVTLDITHDQLLQSGLKLGAPVEVDVGGRRVAGRFLSTFADAPAGTLLLYEDSHRALALALNRGSAADELGIGRDAELRIRPA
jgi:S-adenosyl-L-methionine hydrolase (adenosine-forming)